MPASSSRSARVVIPAKTASAASGWLATSYGVPSAGQQAPVTGQRPPARPVDVQGVVDQPGGSSSTSPVSNCRAGSGLAAVGEEHQLLARFCRARLRGASPRTPPRLRRRQVHPGDQRRSGPSARRPSPATRGGGTPAGTGSGPAGRPRRAPAAGTRSSVGSAAVVRRTRRGRLSRRLIGRRPGRRPGTEISRGHAGRMRTRSPVVPPSRESVDNAPVADELWTTSAAPRPR